MTKIWIQFTWNCVTEEFPLYLEKNKLTLIKDGKPVDDLYPQPGLALKHESGVIMRIMARFSNYENLSHDYLLCANSILAKDVKLFEK